MGLGYDAPQTDFPAVIGRCDGKFVVGCEAWSMYDTLACQYPISKGTITDWDCMEKILHHAYENLHAVPSDHSALITEAPFAPKAQREKMAELIFESLNAPTFATVIPALLVLGGRGRTDGVVVDSGDGITSVVPIHQGYPISRAILRLDVAGRDLTDLLSKGPIGSLSRHTNNDIKEKLCYVTMNIEKEIQIAPPHERTYNLPDGRVITVGSERFSVPEALFQPGMLGIDTPGIHEMTYQSILRCDHDLRRLLTQNIILAGGTTMFPRICRPNNKGVERLGPFVN
ncbi:hypothetical protein ONZ45_g8046 [Pleurotus djamor]|nr:hypothetical protein ONZ45_g8046 [Pleurotus djamor]